MQQAMAIGPEMPPELQDTVERITPKLAIITKAVKFQKGHQSIREKKLEERLNKMTIAVTEYEAYGDDLGRQLYQLKNRLAQLKQYGRQMDAQHQKKKRDLVLRYQQQQFRIEAPTHGLVPRIEAPTHGLVPRIKAPTHGVVPRIEAPTHGVVSRIEAPTHGVVPRIEAPFHGLVPRIETTLHDLQFEQLFICVSTQTIY
jgi:hypothetical protein